MDTQNNQPQSKATDATQTASQEVGYVISSKDYLASLDGLPNVRIHDLVETEQGERAVVNALFKNHTEVFLLDEANVYPGEQFSFTGKHLTIPVGDFLLGRVVNPLMVPIDGKGMIGKTQSQVFELEQGARGIRTREFINQQFLTGITLVDTLVPLGRGQRELVIGDGHSGKTSFLSNCIINAKKNDTICIYAAIGKPTNAIKAFINVLQTNDALKHTVVIASSSTQSPPLILLTPQAAMTVAEYFQKQGKDVLVILDDMGIHAKIYRELSLLGNRSPGRESYPGDIFYQHAKLLERAGRFTKEFGGGSITAMPVVEITMTDFTSFIPTNLMSITDGHLLFKSNLYNKNQRPAIDISLSVSRVGRQTQNVVNNLLSRRIRQTLAVGEERETLSRFSSELSPETQKVLRQKGLIEEIIRQENLSSIPLSIQSVLFAMVYTKFFEDKNDVFLKKHKAALIASLKVDPLLSITDAVELLHSDTELINLIENAAEKFATVWGGLE